MEVKPPRSQMVQWITTVVSFPTSMSLSGSAYLFRRGEQPLPGH